MHHGVKPNSAVKGDFLHQFGIGSSQRAIPIFRRERFRSRRNHESARTPSFVRTATSDPTRVPVDFHGHPKWSNPKNAKFKCTLTFIIGMGEPAGADDSEPGQLLPA
jgi:hypothetical protein